MKSLCTSCMAKPCMCLPEPGEELLYIRISKDCIIQRPKAAHIILCKQKLSNGFQIPSGVSMWVPGLVYDGIAFGGNRVRIPTWKLNQYIRMKNIEDIKKS